MTFPPSGYPYSVGDGLPADDVNDIVDRFSLTGELAVAVSKNDALSVFGNIPEFNGGITDFEDDFREAGFGETTTLTTEFTTQSDKEDSVLLVMAFGSEYHDDVNSSNALGGCTFNGVSMTELAEHDTSNGDHCSAKLFMLKNPPVGTFNIETSLTWSDSGTEPRLDVFAYEAEGFDLETNPTVNIENGSIPDGEQKEVFPSATTEKAGDLLVSFIVVCNRSLGFLSAEAGTEVRTTPSGKGVVLESGIYLTTGTYSNEVNTDLGTGGDARYVCFNVILNRKFQTSLALTDATIQFSVDRFVGFANSDGSAGETIKFKPLGLLRGLTGLTPGAIQYLSDTPGEISDSAGTIERKVGRAVSETDVAIDLSV